VPASAWLMVLIQIGPAIPEPPFLMGVLSLFPTHIPSANCGVYPIVHASRCSSVVPVLTAAVRPGSVRDDPKTGALAALSDNILDIRYAPSGLRAGVVTARGARYTAALNLSSIRWMITGS